MEKKREKEEIISHVIFNRRTGDVYINVPRYTELYRIIVASVAKNGSAKGIRVVLSIKSARVIKEENE